MLGAFTPHEVRDIERMLKEHERELLEAWYERFGTYTRRHK
jgi:hypothetical protein